MRGASTEQTEGLAPTVPTLDTNVIISAVLSPSGPPAEIISHWEADLFEVVTSPPLLVELERALEYPRVKKYLKTSPDEADLLVKRLRRVATVVQPQHHLEVVEQDPADNPVLECAVTGEASYIVTGNDHLLKIQKYEEIAVLRPSEFLLLLRLR